MINIVEEEVRKGVMMEYEDIRILRESQKEFGKLPLHERLLKQAEYMRSKANNIISESIKNNIALNKEDTRVVNRLFYYAEYAEREANLLIRRMDESRN